MYYIVRVIGFLLNINDGINRKNKSFCDRSGKQVTFMWWLRWIIAFWHLRQWSRYEGLSNEKNTFEDVIEFNRKINY